LKKEYFEDRIMRLRMCSAARHSMLAVIVVLVFGVPLSVFADLNEAFEAVHKKDYEKAYQLFLEAAKTGDAEAQDNLAILIREGKGTTKNLANAIGWFRKAAEQGQADAQYQLGNMYEFGLGVPQSYQEAASWYKKSAEQGHPSAQTNLAVLYANGQGVKQDIVLAYVWSNLAASQGVIEALQNREMVAKEMSAEMLQKVRAVSREYFQKYVSPFQSEASKHVAGRPLLPPPPKADKEQ
jgi:TPR repeat protein